MHSNQGNCTKSVEADKPVMQQISVKLLYILVVLQIGIKSDSSFGIFPTKITAG